MSNPSVVGGSTRRKLLEVGLATLITAILGIGANGNASASLKTLDNYSVLDLKGKPRYGGIQDYIKAQGSPKPAIVALGAYWCLPCGDDIAILNEISAQYSGKLYVVGVNSLHSDKIKEDAKKTVQWLTEFSAQYPSVLMSGNEMGRLLRENGLDSHLPVNFLIDKEYRIHLVENYLDSAAQARLREKINILIK